MSPRLSISRDLIASMQAPSTEFKTSLACWRVWRQIRLSSGEGGCGMRFLSWFFGRRREPPEDLEGGLSEARGAITRGVASARVQWPNSSFPMEVVGESNYQQAFIEVCGPQSRDGHDQQLNATIELEPSNPHDPTR
jgi:hypothetical protein